MDRSAILHISPHQRPLSAHIKLTLTISGHNPVAIKTSRLWWVRGLIVFEGGSKTFGLANGGGDVAIADAMATPLRTKVKPGWRAKLANADLVPDLGEDIGSLRWFRGLATLTLLTIFTLALLPDIGPVYGAQSPMPTQVQLDAARTQTIMPIAYGSDTGSRMAANENVIALAGSN
jgi:hypothetical protein